MVISILKSILPPQIECPYGELEIEPYDDALLSRMTNLKSSLMVTPIVNLIMAQNQA